MSQFDDKYDDAKVVCPYCGYWYQPEAEDYSEDERAEECEECGKHFYLAQSFSVTHITSPDCELNGIQHEYELVNLKGGKSHPFCTVCGKCMPMSMVIR